MIFLDIKNNNFDLLIMLGKIYYNIFRLFGSLIYLYFLCLYWNI